MAPHSVNTAPLATIEAHLEREDSRVALPIDDSILNGILICGKFTGEIAKNIFDAEDDFITTRAICLRGLEPGINLGVNIDSEERGIWIHGTAQEKFIGTPASHGCIRMRNSDVIELFNLVKIGDIVDIVL